MFCVDASKEKNQEEGELTLILKKIITPQTNNEGRN